MHDGGAKGEKMQRRRHDGGMKSIGMWLEGSVGERRCSSVRLKLERWSGRLAWHGAVEVIAVCRGKIIMCRGKWRREGATRKCWRERCGEGGWCGSGATGKVAAWIGEMV